MLSPLPLPLSHSDFGRPLPSLSSPPSRCCLAFPFKVSSSRDSSELSWRSQDCKQTHRYLVFSYVLCDFQVPENKVNEISAIRRIRPANLRGDPRQVQSAAAGRAVRQVFRRGQIRRRTRKQGKFGESNFAPQLNFILSLLCEGRRATTQGGA